MNQTQRDYLIDRVNSTCREQIEELQSQIPDQPSLNNYLVAAFLDNSIKFNDIVVLKKKMREAVLKFGTSDQLVYEEDQWGKKRRNLIQETVHVKAEDLFILPQNYLDALKEYETKRDEIQKKIDELEATKNTIIMKIQIGSASVLDKLVLQVDSMGDLNLMNTTLMLGDGKK